MNIFFNIMELPIEQRIAVLHDAKDVCETMYVDELSVLKSMRRQRIDMSFEEIIKKVTKNTSFTFVIRTDNKKEYLEVGLQTVQLDESFYSKEYFLWIICDIKHAFDLTAKYQLKRLT